MNRKKIGLGALIFLSLNWVFVANTHAAVFNVNTAAELQAALDNAEMNGEDDTINLAGNTFSTVDNGGLSFTYTAVAAEDKKIALVGSGIGSTLLTGAAGVQVLSIITASATNDSPAGVTLQNLSLSSDGTIGLSAIVEGAFILVDGVEFLQVNTGASNSLISTMAGPITLKNSSVTGFDGSFGIFITTDTGPVALENNQISQNVSGLLVGSSNGSQVNIVGNTFTSNSTLGLSASLADSTVNFSDNIIQAHDFLGIQIGTTDGSQNINANLIEGNHAIQGLLASESGAGPIVVTNNIFHGNESLTSGAGMGVSTETGLVTVTNNTFFDNFAATGAGMFIDLKDVGSAAEVFNNIFFENFSFFANPGADLFIQDDNDTSNPGPAGAPVTVSHNILFDFSTTCLEDNTDCTPNVTTNTIIMEDPLFVDGPNGDFNLLPHSPAIAAGDLAAPALPTADFVGNPMNNPPDLGALQAVASILVDPDAINFGQISTDVPNTQTITIQNIGGLDLNVTDIVLDDTTNFSLNFSGGNDPCGASSFTLAGGDSCTITVTFRPQDDGAFAATITITSNDDLTPSLAIPLEGIGSDDGGGCGCKFGDHVKPNVAWFGIFLILLPWAILRFRTLKR